MSKRHQDAKPLRRNRAVRKKEMRRDRHHAHQELRTVGDPDALVVPAPRYDHAPHKPPKPRRIRHWKTREWKRRTAMRRQRNAALEQLARAD